jgi:DNA polymerase-3 subunit beta
VRFEVNRDIFSEAVSFAVKLLPQRTTLPILSGVLIEAEGGTVTFSAFDYESSARTTIGADVAEPGRALVSGRLLADIASRLPAAPVEVAVADGRVSIRCGAGRFTLLPMPVDEYPALPEVAARGGLVPGDVFADAIGQVVLAASRDDVTPVITGVQLEVGPNSLSLVATDRYRVAIRDIPWDAGDSGVSEATALVPARILAEIGKTFAHAPTVQVSIVGDSERELIAFSADERAVTSLLIKGNYPPVKRLFPQTVEDYAVVSTSDLVEAVRRVALVLAREAALRFTFSTDGLTLEAVGGEQAQASETIDAVLTGQDTVVSLKPQFLLDALGAVHSEFVRLGFTRTDNPNKPGPVLITAQTSAEGTGSTFRYLLQPNLLLR